MIRSRNIVPFILSSIAVVAVQGCIGIPLPEHPQSPSGHEVRSLIGDARSSRPLRIGVTNRLQVIDQLGPPQYCTVHDVAIGYRYSVPSTRWFGPLVASPHAGFPFIGPYTYADYFLFLDFDLSGILKECALHRIDGGVDVPVEQRLWVDFVEHVHAVGHPTTETGENSKGTEKSGGNANDFR